jgi:hypothetical protein
VGNELAAGARFVGFGLACALAVLGAGTLAPHAALDARLAFATAYTLVTLEILGFAWFAPAARWLPVLAVAGLAAAFALGGVDATPASAAALTAVLGLGAAAVGAVLGARIQNPAHLAAVGLVSAIADLWSVFDPGAPSAQLAAQALAAPETLTAFALPFPLLGTPLIPAVIGAGDVVFTALYVATFRAHGLALPRLLVALGLAFGVGLLVLLTTLSPIPLLPLLATAVIASEPAARALERREWFTVLSVCAVLLGAIVLRVL